MKKGTRTRIVAGLAVLAVAALLVIGYSMPRYSMAAGNSSRYTVVRGDSLYWIARNHGITVSALKQANGLTSDLIMPGQVLAIPDSGSGSAAGAYTVQKGDTLWLIAQKRGVSVSSLKSANGLKSDLIMPGQTLVIPSGQGGGSSTGSGTLADVIRDKGIANPQAKLRLTVDKSSHTLTVYYASTWLKSYHVELGDGGSGDKNVAGDHKTPEGSFYVTEKSILSPADYYLGTRWMRLSYPNVEDANRGLNQGIINQSTHDQIVSAINRGQTPPQNTALGGGIGVHGGSVPSFGPNWTFGCVGLTNHDVEEIFNYVQVGTPVTITQ